jgi:hypothetical protein
MNLQDRVKLVTVSVPATRSVFSPFDNDEFIQYLRSKLSSASSLPSSSFKSKHHSRTQTVTLEIPFALWLDLARKTKSPKEALAELLYEYFLEKEIRETREGTGYYVCPYCKARDVIISEGFYVCRSCGVVIDRVIGDEYEYDIVGGITDVVGYMNSGVTLDNNSRQFYNVITTLLHVNTHMAYMLANSASATYSCLLKHASSVKLKSRSLTRYGWILRSIALYHTLRGYQVPLENIVKEFKRTADDSDVRQVRLIFNILKSRAGNCLQ